MNLFRLENPEYLYLLIIIPILVVLFIYTRYLRRKKLSQFGDIRLIAQLNPDTSGYKPAVKFSLMLAVLILLIIGLANPQIGSKMIEIKREGIDVVIAMDVSNSMLSDDIKPDRLSRAKQLVSKLIDRLQNDRIGIVVFAGDAFKQLPLTTDYSAAKLILSTIDNSTIPLQGTAIGKAISLGIESFPEDDKKPRVMIIITDGENHEDDAIGMASEAAKKNIIIHTIGMGTIKGGPIPVYGNGGRKDFMRDKDGSIIITKLDATMLQQVASAGNGTFIRSADSDPDLSSLLNKIAKLDKKEYGSKLYTDYDDKFQYIFALALMLIIIEFMLSERKNKYIAALNQFVEKRR